MWKKVMLLLVLAGGALTLAAQDVTLKLGQGKPGGIYKNGETVVFTVQALADGKPVAGKEFVYELRSDSRDMVRKTAVSAEAVVEVKSGLSKPGWTWITAYLPDENGKAVKGSHRHLGAMIEPEAIRQGMEEPKDFAAFWQEQRKILDRVPVKAVLDDAGVIERDGVKYQCYDVKVDCASVTPVSGYLTIPQGAEKGTLKAMVRYQGAGVYSSGKAVNPNAVILEINAHGIINGQPREFYQQLSQTGLADYRYWNSDNRNRFYFREMFLRVMRSLDYIKTRPEWDGKTLVVYGSSQGGAQALVAAGLDKDVTLCVACVPALSDHGGILAGRESGWPRLIGMKDGKPVNEKVVETSGYYDCVNFAKRIKAEVCISVGLVDRTCVPTSVYAAYNNLSESPRKSICVMPDKGHVADNVPGWERINEVLSAK